MQGGLPRKIVDCCCCWVFVLFVGSTAFAPIPFRSPLVRGGVETTSNRHSHLWSTTQSSSSSSSSSSSPPPPPPGSGDTSSASALPNGVKPDAYTVLGLARDASVDQVKSSYRKLAKAYHPDANPEDERNTTTVLFQTIQEAYEVAIVQARYRRDLAKKRDEALKNKKNQPFVRMGLDTVDMYPTPTATTEYDPTQTYVHAPSSPTAAERELRARATGSYQQSSSSYHPPQQPRRTRPTTPFNSNSPHRPWPAPSPPNWGTQSFNDNNNPPMSTPFKAAARRRTTPYVYNSNPYRNRRPYTPPPPEPKNGYVPHSVATAQPRGPSWSRPRPANYHVQANTVDGRPQWNSNPYAGTSSRPRPQRRRQPNFVQPNFGVGTTTNSSSRRKNVFAKRRPPYQPYQPPSSGWWGQTTHTSTGTYTPPQQQQNGWANNNNNNEYFSGQQTNQNGRRRPQQYNNRQYFSDVLDE